jgi:ribosomal protein S18 acetylase RimI-like enzyme
VTLPEPVRAFWYAACELEGRAKRTAWGVVVSDHRYPRVHDANNAAVVEPDPAVTADQIRAVLHPALRAAGAPIEHIEFWETSVESPALAELRRTGAATVPDVPMVLEAPAGHGPPTQAVVEELTDPDDEFWAWYRTSRNEFGDPLDDEVLDQLLARDREVFVPAGLRFFIGYLGGDRAGYASLLSLAGVGYVDNVVTMPEHRRRGVAAAAVTAVAEASRQGDDRALFLLAEEGGAPARLYERLGFRVRGRIESFTQPLGQA